MRVIRFLVLQDSHKKKISILWRRGIEPKNYQLFIKKQMWQQLQLSIFFNQLIANLTLYYVKGLGL